MNEKTHDLRLYYIDTAIFLTACAREKIHHDLDICTNFRIYEAIQDLLKCIRNGKEPFNTTWYLVSKIHTKRILYSKFCIYNGGKYATKSI